MSRIRSYHQSSVSVTQLKGPTELASPSAWVYLLTSLYGILSDSMQGLDPGRYRSTTANETEGRRFSTLDSQLPDSERYKDAAPFVVRCRACECSVGFPPVANRAVRLYCT